MEVFLFTDINSIHSALCDQSKYLQNVPLFHRITAVLDPASKSLVAYAFITTCIKIKVMFSNKL